MIGDCEDGVAVGDDGGGGSSNAVGGPRGAGGDGPGDGTTRGVGGPTNGVGVCTGDDGAMIAGSVETGRCKDGGAARLRCESKPLVCDDT